MSDHDKLKKTFFAEGQEILENLDGLLLEMEKDPCNLETLNSIFRQIHTFKGSCGIFEFHALERFVHIQEDLLDCLRTERICPTSGTIDVLFEAVDLTKAAFERLKEGKEVKAAAFAAVEERIKEFLPRQEEHTVEKKTPVDNGISPEFINRLSPSLKETARKAAEEGKRLYQISLCLNNDCMKEGIDPLLLIKRLRYDGEVVFTRTEHDRIPPLAELDPTTLYFKEITILYASNASTRELTDVFEFALEAGVIAVHLFTPAELSERFGIETDPFWTEASSPGEDEEVPGPASRSRIEVFKKEVEDCLKDVKKNIARLETSPNDPDALNVLFRFFHNITGNSGILGLAELGGVAAIFEDLIHNIRTGIEKTTAEIIRELRQAVEVIEWMLGEVLENIGQEFKQDLDGDREIRKGPIGDILDREEIFSRDNVGRALEAQIKGLRAQTAVRIDAERLDNLVDMVGELVIAQTLVAQDDAVKGLADARLEKNIAQLAKITKNIQGHVMRMRMLPLAQTFQKLSRVARDVSKKAGKEVVLKVSGEDTEVDKTAIDNIGDPLVHILRNAVDHGIESPEERKALGKPTTGTIEIRAFHHGGNVVIEVKDDGKGISREHILKKAGEKGLITEESDISDSRIYNLIFEPGFSTSDTVTEISGRGVGLDVVKKNLEKLRGSVDVATEPAKGTSFTLKLPLTLAIIDGMVVNVGQERYIIPTLSVESSLKPSRDDVTTVAGRGEMANIRGNLYPVVRLRDLFKVDSESIDPWDAILIIVESGGEKCCLMVDNIIGHQQAVIKSLGERFKGLQGVSSCTILGDGKVGLIIDVGGIMRMVNR